MDSSEFGAISPLLNDILVWIGYGTVVGLLAKGVMPGRDPGGAIATLVMGIAGVIMGCGVYSLFAGGHRVTPLSMPGLICGTVGALGILFFYRMLNGQVLDEVGSTRWRAYGGPRVRFRRRRSGPVYFDE
ncbi:MAG: GlsB/YeaQ/YmgE family stress response membrane protein [Pirellulales bacterium]